MHAKTFKPIYGDITIFKMLYTICKYHVNIYMMNKQISCTLEEHKCCFLHVLFILYYLTYLQNGSIQICYLPALLSPRLLECQ